MTADWHVAEVGGKEELLAGLIEIAVPSELTLLGERVRALQSGAEAIERLATFADHHSGGVRHAAHD